MAATFLPTIYQSDLMIVPVFKKSKIDDNAWAKCSIGVINKERKNIMLLYIVWAVFEKYGDREEHWKRNEHIWLQEKWNYIKKYYNNNYN